MSAVSQPTLATRAFGAPAVGIVGMVAEGETRPVVAYHDTLTFCLLRTGGARWTYRRASHDLTPGTLCLIEPGEVHRVHEGALPSSYVVLYVDASVAAGDASLRDLRHFASPQTRDPAVVGPFRALRAAVASGADRLFIEEALASFLTTAFARHGERDERLLRATVPREHRAVRRARALLHDRAGEDLSLDELARETGLHKRYLIDVFRRETGSTPHAYQIAIRVSRARRLLARGEPPAAVATSLGFADQTHFTRHFKRVVGMTPGAFARAVRGI